MNDTDVTSAVAVLASQMGELKHAVDGTLREHGQRISKLEEKEIRRQAREETEARVRAEITEEHEHHEDRGHERRTIELTRRQVWIGVVGTVLAFATVVVLAVAQFH